MASRIFPCLAATCCLALLLPPPVQGRRPAGLQEASGGLGGRSRLHLLPAVPKPRFFLPTQAAAEEERRAGVPAAAAWSVTRPELRAVPGGPDPLHHHGGGPSRRPDPEQDRTPSP